MKTPALKLEAKRACRFLPSAGLTQISHVGMNKAGQHQGRNKYTCVDLNKHNLVFIPDAVMNWQMLVYKYTLERIHVSRLKFC